MNAKEKLFVNNLVNHEIGQINKSIDETVEWISYKRLRTCQAYVYETEKYYVLRSYSTPVAAIRKENGFGFDFLRLVYGYTATSAHHIAKFFNDYGAKQRLVYRP